MRLEFAHLLDVTRQTWKYRAQLMATALCSIPRQKRLASQ